jgi:hypothetical protein
VYTVWFSSIAHIWEKKRAVLQGVFRGLPSEGAVYFANAVFVGRSAVIGRVRRRFIQEEPGT